MKEAERVEKETRKVMSEMLTEMYKRTDTDLTIEQTKAVCNAIRKVVAGKGSKQR